MTTCQHLHSVEPTSPSLHARLGGGFIRRGFLAFWLPKICNAEGQQESPSPIQGKDTRELGATPCPCTAGVH